MQFLHADNEDSDQTELVLVFVGCTFQNVQFLMLRLITESSNNNSICVFVR